MKKMEEIELLRAKRATLDGLFQSDYTKATKKTMDLTQEDTIALEACLEDLKETYEKTNKVSDDIENVFSNLKDKVTEMQEDIDEAKKIRSDQRHKLLIVRKLFETTKPTKSTPIAEAPTLSKTSKTAQLPKLKLPTFDGTYTKWNSFWDTIKADVLAGNYENITKFNYIMGQLKGAALDAVTGLHPSGDNLKTLTEVLEDRFGQPRKIIRAHVTNILDLDSPKYEYSSLSGFYNSVMGDIRSLETLNVNVTECSAILVPIIERKLPKIMREKMGTSDQGNQFNLLKFLKSFNTHLDNIGERADHQQPNQNQDYGKRNQEKRNHSSLSSFVGATEKRKCQTCRGPHSIFECPMSVQDKYRAARSKRLCFNCLGEHQSKECRSQKRCRQCNKKHHSVLHEYFGESQSVENFQQTTSGCAYTSISGLESQDKSPYQSPLQDKSPNQSPIQDELSNQSLVQDKPSNQSPVQDESPNQSQTLEKPPEKSQEESQFQLNSCVAQHEPVLLETGKIKLANGNREITAGVLMDRGSMASYVRREIATKLGLKPHKSQVISVHGIGGHSANKHFEIANLDVITREGPKRIEAIIMDEIVKPIRQNGWAGCLRYEYINNLELANDFKDTSFSVDILIGCDYAYEFLENRIIKGNGPMAQCSNLGWFLSGPLRTTPIHSAMGVTVTSPNESGGHQTVQDEEISLLEKYIQDNIITGSEVSDNLSDELFKQKFKDSIQYRDGHYFVPLPWKEDHEEIPNNIANCESRLRQVMRRLQKLNLVDAYTAVMQENLEKGYISECGEHYDKNEEGYFLPHFPVLRDSETTPVRIVFDASSGEVSLNSCLYEGPNMLQDLTQLMYRFRTKKIAISADIARAFLSVRLIEKDRKYVKFLWYKDNDPNKHLVPYHCNTIIFGNVSSPFALAITLDKHLSAFQSPVAEDMKSKTYVDNLFSGVNSDKESVEYYQESRDIMEKGSFALRQWASNSLKLREVATADGLNAKSDDTGLAGMRWTQSTDTMTLAKKELTNGQDLTKRIVTSHTASIFDPLGLLGPLIVPAKVFINQLWVEEKSWDEKLSENENQEWNGIKQSLNKSHEVRFPRWLGGDVNQALDIIVFCDACPKTAAGCVAYAKQGDNIALLGSKNKVVSKKNGTMTVPKLELMAMAMGAQYGDYLRNIYAQEFKSVNVTYTTDSEIALHWLKSNKKLTQFVKNRVELVKKLTNVDAWYHVTTTDNIADILSRGANFRELQKSQWIEGPEWLRLEREHWPLTGIMNLNSKSMVTLSASLEMDNEFDSGHNKQVSTNVENVIDITRFSSYNKLLRVTALVNRAFRKGLDRKRNALNASDIKHAETLWIKRIQTKTYANVREYLQKEQSNLAALPKRPSIINQLGLVLDKQGIIRCGGRLRNANVALDRKYPILLPHTEYLTTLLVRNAHHEVAHYGIGNTMTHLRNKYWITSMRSTVKKILKRCTVCKIIAGRAFLTPIAPQLPDFRINDLQAFKSTGIDFTSHIYVRGKDTSQNKTRKVYICLFTCCTTRAIHLEVVPDMTCETFLRAFRRFASSYSTPDLVFCDNAKTFKSASIELKRLYQNVACETSQKYFAKKGITFKHIPVEASWFGSVYERVIGVCKNGLKKTLGKALVSMDELSTLIKEIQLIVNNRPLTHQMVTPHEPTALTPNHLIFGHELSMVALENCELDSAFDPSYKGKTDLEKLSYHRTKLLTHFRKRFMDEYLAMLRERHQYEIAKQNTKTDQIRVGDVVLIHSKDKPRIQWKLGVVENLNTGQDKLTRSAVVRSASGSSHRAIGKLYPLELNIGILDNQTKASVRAEPQTRPRRSAAETAKLKIKQQCWTLLTGTGQYPRLMGTP